MSNGTNSNNILIALVNRARVRKTCFYSDHKLQSHKLLLRNKTKDLLDKFQVFDMGVRLGL